jgi:hypothetical protein
MMITRQLFHFVLLGLSMTVVGGCGGAPPAAISGKVTYQGAEIKSGSIRFYPTTKETGRGAFAAINDGQYQIPLAKGLLAGTYTVSITADKLSGPKASEIPKVRGGSGGNPEPVEYIPAEFNDDSQLRFDVVPGENGKDFELPIK